tara:strand:+ start:226 stop:564 length:339 start_codon:yes stop_codon:yes gene_type:complete
MNLTLIIKAGMHADARHRAALRFAEQAINDGYTLTGVFFYADAVSLASAAAANNPYSQSWCGLAGQHHFDLVVCHTAAERQGIEQFNPAFEPAGLTQLVNWMNTADKVVTLS